MCVYVCMCVCMCVADEAWESKAKKNDNVAAKLFDQVAVKAHKANTRASFWESSGRADE